MFKVEKKKVLVVTLSCGEPQFERCIKSVKDQLGVNCDIKVISNKPNYDAHYELYDSINTANKNYDYFVKLDADMEFSRLDSLSRVLDFFDENVDHLTIPVHDYFVGGDTPAFHVYSNRARFKVESIDHLYPDRLEVIYPGFRKNVKSSHHLVLHCNKPSQGQAISFGIHRALKLYQSGRPDFDPKDCLYHYRTICKVYENFKKNDSDKNLEVALKSASEVLLRSSDSTMVHKKSFMMKSYDDYRSVHINEMFEKFSLFRLIRFIGFYKFSKGIAKVVLKSLLRN
ncbi:hypothetical protein [Idiomarina loihiensis]|uniref:hypothetical protein n=1 Tax=Idiomarina loihiensis TaxID=135577 RepID=UPI0031596234